MKLLFFLVSASIFFKISCTESNNCWKSGLCMGSQIQVKPCQKEDDCLQRCVETPDCEWFTYDPVNRVCHLNKACYKVLTSFDGLLHGHRYCNPWPKDFTKLLVAGGIDNNTNKLSTVEVLDIHTDPAFECKNLPNLHNEVEGAVGGLINGTPIICGGTSHKNFVDYCYTLHNTSGPSRYKWKKADDMKEERSQAAGTVATINITQQSLVITGGSGPTLHKSCEVLHGPFEEWHHIQDLPTRMYGHCVININETTLLIIGGSTDSSRNSHSAKTYFFDWTKEHQQTWKLGPQLATQRRDQACGLLIHNNNKKTAVVAGGWKTTESQLSSVEMLDIDNYTHGWYAGSDLPYPLWKATMVDEPQTNSVLIVGGESKETQQKNLLRLYAPDSNWIVQQKQLRTGRSGHVSFFIPDQLAECFLPTN